MGAEILTQTDQETRQKSREEIKSEGSQARFELF